MVSFHPPPQHIHPTTQPRILLVYFVFRNIVPNHAINHTPRPCPRAGSSTSGFSPDGDDSDDEDPLIRELEEKERQMARELKDFDSILAERERERRREEWRKGRGL